MHSHSAVEYYFAPFPAFRITGDERLLSWAFDDGGMLGRADTVGSTLYYDEYMYVFLMNRIISSLIYRTIGSCEAYKWSWHVQRLLELTYA